MNRPAEAELFNLTLYPLARFVLSVNDVKAERREPAIERRIKLPTAILLAVTVSRIEAIASGVCWFARALSVLMRRSSSKKCG